MLHASAFLSSPLKFLKCFLGVDGAKHCLQMALLHHIGNTSSSLPSLQTEDSLRLSPKAPNSLVPKCRTWAQSRRTHKEQTEKRIEFNEFNDFFSLRFFDILFAKYIPLTFSLTCFSLFNGYESNAMVPG